jgi:hypothetical protein
MFNLFKLFRILKSKFFLSRRVKIYQDDSTPVVVGSQFLSNKIDYINYQPFYEVPKKLNVLIKPGYLPVAKLSLNFGNVDGDFIAGSIGLKNLTGFPKKVRGNLLISGNKLKNLKNSPEFVWGDFYCKSNKIIDLEGAPEQVGGDFNCSKNFLKNLKNSPRIVNGNFDCRENLLTCLKGSPKYVGGNFYCFDNNIWTFEGAPERIGGNFFCQDNPIYELWMFMNSYSDVEIFNNYNPIVYNSGEYFLIENKFIAFLDEINAGDNISKIRNYKFL